MGRKKKLCTCGKTKTPPYCDYSHRHEIIEMPEMKISPIADKILLLALPYWTPLVPPQGIAHLKHFLQHHNYRVKTKDANIEEKFRELYNKYFGTLSECIPVDKQGNFFNIGHDVMRNHMIAHINYEDESEYIELVRLIVYNTFFERLSDHQVDRLNAVLAEFYRYLGKYMLRLLEEERPAVLGISVFRDTIGPSLFAFRLAKKVNPDIMTVMGGCVFSDHLLKGTPNFENFLKQTPYIDKIIIGEGQILFLKLLRGEFPRSRRVFTLEDINWETLGYSPLNQPDLSDFMAESDYPYQSAQASSSCPYQCSFCNVAAFYGKYREKDPEQTVKEMQALYQKYGVRVFFMNDALLNYIATPLADAFNKTDLSLYWDGYLRVAENVCDLDTTLHWRRGGLYRCRLGVESGSQRVLDAMGKDITPELTRCSLANLAEAGIKTTAYWVIGHPGETEEDFLQTLRLLEETKDNIYEAECNPIIYGYAGQAASDKWKEKRVPLYPEEKARNIMILQSWYVDGIPSREETYERVNRFARHCKKLGIPNPYSMHDIYKADQRWKELHKNAVPPLIDLNDKNIYVEEKKYVKKLSLLQDTLQDDGDFGF
jgi:radical SAM superfamily enzyme YgiQ (UPF0313 family)